MNCLADRPLGEFYPNVVAAFRMTDGTMSPWREAGSTIYAQRERLQAGDYAILTIADPATPACLVGKLVSISPTVVTLDYFNPPLRIRVCRRRIGIYLRAISCDDIT